MRRLSIYVTLFFSKTPLSPTAVTFLSIMVGLLGAPFLAKGSWILGVLLVNGWYLLDHADGELARLKNQGSVTGFYLDTIANAIVPFFTFLFFGYGLGRADLGVAAAYASEMLLIVEYCKSAVLTQSKVPSSYEKASPKGASHPWKIAFRWLHRSVTFPSYLMFWTVITAATIPMDIFLKRDLLIVFLAVYAFLANAIWIAILSNIILSKKLDRGSGV